MEEREIPQTDNKIINICTLIYNNYYYYAVKYIIRINMTQQNYTIYNLLT